MGYHQYRRYADGVDAADHGQVGPEFAHVQTNLDVLAVVQEHRHPEGDDLADHGGDGRALRAHPKAQYEYGVQYDVDDGAGALGEHRVDGAAGGLHQPLEHDLAEHAEAEAADGGQVVHAVVDERLDLGLGGEERPHAEQAEQQEQHIAHQRQEHAVLGHLVGALRVLRAQRPGEQRVHAHRRAGGEPDHQVLGREGQRHRRQRRLVVARHEEAVHHVVQRLHQHGQYHRQRHVDNQLGDGHDAHLVLSGCVVLHRHPLFHLYCMKL